jgi:hypothetical protein
MWAYKTRLRGQGNACHRDATYVYATCISLADTVATLCTKRLKDIHEANIGEINELCECLATLCNPDVADRLHCYSLTSSLSNGWNCEPER